MVTEQPTKHIYSTQLSNEFYVATSLAEAQELRARHTGPLPVHEGPQPSHEDDYFTQVEDAKILTCDYQGKYNVPNPQILDLAEAEADSPSRLSMRAGDWARLLEVGYFMSEDY